MALPPEPSTSRPDLPAQDIGLWMAEYGTALQRFFAKRVGPADAEDLVQEVFVHLQARATDSEVENVERYLFRIARNVLINRHRLQLRTGAGDTEPMDPAFEIADEISPERSLIAKQLVGQLGAALHALPPRTRDAFIFHRFEEMTYPVIAKRMGISVNGVEKLIKRALAQLATKMERRR